MRTTLIISTYKTPDFLNRVLESVFRQSQLPDQIIVTEDGEDSKNRELLTIWKSRFAVPFLHLTQKDIGNRKPLALNKAVLNATEDYLIFIDGDCVLRNDFIRCHLKAADPRCFLTGRRVELSARATNFLTAEKISEGYLERIPLRLLWDSVFGDTQYLGRFFRTPLWLRKTLKQDVVHDIRGCNFSVFRDAMKAINGFGNDFSGAYGEDSDVEIRLKFLGLKMKSVKGDAIQYHLWHKTQIKDQTNQERLRNVTLRGQARTENGLEEASKII